MKNVKTNNKKINQSWKPYLKMLKDSKILIGWRILYLVLSMALTTVYAQLPQVQGQIMAGEIQDSATIWTYVWATVASSLITLPFSLLAAWISAKTNQNLRTNIWGKIIHQPMSHLDTVSPTSLVSRVTTDIDETAYSIDYVFNLISFAYSMVVMWVMIAGMNQNMGLMLLVLIPFIIISTLPGKLMHNVNYEAKDAMSKYTNFLSERLGNLKQIKASGAEEKEDAINDAAARAYFKANAKRAGVEMIMQPLNYSMEAVVQAVVLIYGGYLLSIGEMDTASMVALYSYTAYFYIYPLQFAFCWKYLKISQGNTQAVAEFIQHPAEVMEREKSFAIPDADIKLENVSFAYENGEEVLHNVSMEIPTGKVTAIVGPSGSGKTTVLKLLERLYQPTDGQILFGDTPAEKIHLNEWREAFGMVPQSSPLLFGSIKDNITYGLGNEPVEEARLQQVLADSNVDEIIERLPDGLASDVGDVGSKLSGGEKQRIAIARMMMCDPSYVLLDEATSSLDAENEHEITQALNRLTEGRTTVIVAHNLRTVKKADNIIFMEDGTVKAEGTHDQLYRDNETYRRYVDLQYAK